MSPDPNQPLNRRETRRQFLKKTGMITAAMAAADFFPLSLSAAEPNSSVYIILDELSGLINQVPVQWAAGQLGNALAARGIKFMLNQPERAPAKNLRVFVTGGDSPYARQLFNVKGAPFGLSLLKTPESFGFFKGIPGGDQKTLLVVGSDTRGLVYALLELADRVNHADNPLNVLRMTEPVVEHPANPIRSISRLFTSDVEDKPWFNDRAFWQKYLTMLATNRFNRFNLGFGLGYDFTTDITDCYFHFAYPFLLTVPGYDVRAVPLPDAERDANLQMLRFISDEAARRGLQFQIGLWTHAYQWTDSPRANYTITGLTPQTQGPYCRDALRLLLTQCPNITGITLRTHGESGVAEGDTEIWKTILSAVADCGRKVEIDLHAKGINQTIIDTALATGMPVNISPKVWAEHMGLPYMAGAIRPQEMPPLDKQDNGFFSRSSGSRSFLRYGYGDLFEENRRYGVLHRIWPGTQRLLLWGDPEIAAAYGRVAGFCGGNGVEILEPLTFKGRKGSGLPGGRNAYADATLKPAFDFEKYEYTYCIWGRNLYNPDSDGDGWRRWLRSRLGRSAEPMEAALSTAGKILPLVTTAYCPSAANNLYWPEMYWDFQMTDAGHKNPYSDTLSPKRFGTVSPLDPEFFSNCDEFAAELMNGTACGKKSPVWAAARLDDYAEQTLRALRKLRSHDDSNADFPRLMVDATIQAGLGKFYAAKFRAGVFYSLYLSTQDPKVLQEALRESSAARAAWVELADTAKGIYINDVTFGPDYYQRGHWSDRLVAMDADNADMEKLLSQSSSGPSAKVDWNKIYNALAKAGKGELKWKADASNSIHTPPASFRRGNDFTIIVQPSALEHFGIVAGMQLRYRHVNQGEYWQEMDMQADMKGFRATIPAAYIDSPFPLQYYFRLKSGSGGVILRPGLETMFNGQPYYVVRQA